MIIQQTINEYSSVLNERNQDTSGDIIYQLKKLKIRHLNLNYEKTNLSIDDYDFVMGLYKVKDNFYFGRNLFYRINYSKYLDIGIDYKQRDNFDKDQQKLSLYRYDLGISYPNCYQRRIRKILNKYNIILYGYNATPLLPEKKEKMELKLI